MIKKQTIAAFCWGCGFKHSKDYNECVWDKQP